MSLVSKLKSIFKIENTINNDLLEFSKFDLDKRINTNSFFLSENKEELLKEINWENLKIQINEKDYSKYPKSLQFNIDILCNIDDVIDKANKKYIDDCINNNIIPEIFVEINKEDISSLFIGETMLYEKDEKIILDAFSYNKISEVIKYKNVYTFINSIGNQNLYNLINIKYKIDDNNIKYLDKLKTKEDEINLKEDIKKDTFNVLEYFKIDEYISQKKKIEIINHNNINNICLEEINAVVKVNNKKFIEQQLEIQKEYLDNILKESDPIIKLDNEQRTAILSDEDYTLIIAGAGAGKTTTVSAKVKYLVEKKNIDPKDILVVSFTNKAVDELKDRINKDLKIECPIVTFHATGNAIIRKTTSGKLNIVNEGYLYNAIRSYIKTEVMTDPDILQKMILFFSYHINLDLEVNSLEEAKKKLQIGKYETLKSSIEEITEQLIQDKISTKRTIKSEVVSSIEEVRIANFLYLNGVDYEYESQYPHHIEGSKKMYTPDFTIKQDGKIIYLEHYGITENGTHSYYNEEQLKKYKKAIVDKENIHKSHNTKLIHTFSSYNDSRDLLVALEELLLNNGIKFTRKSNKEVYEKLIGDEDVKYFHSFIKLVLNFIGNFKTNGYSENDFIELKVKSTNERNKIFLDIVKPIYLYYQNKLATDSKVDFQDLINNSISILENAKDLNVDFKYIIVDEYQDISQQRFDLTKKLAEVTNAKIIAVGDDWQSIYAFSGSRLELFTKFQESMGYANVLQITHTYRNSQELIDIAGKFIQENDSQIKKKLISPKNLSYPIAVFTYSDDSSKNKSKGISGILEEKAEAIEKALRAIVKRQKDDNSSILLLGRYGFDGSRLGKTSLFTYNDKTNKLIANNFPNFNITFMTAHSSKGLGYDDVIIINSEEGIYGFPTQIVDDPILKMVLAADNSYSFAEERRLFYVALTRTKNRVYITAPKNNPSRFLVELLENNDNIYLDDEDIAMEIKQSYNKKFNVCPACGFPIHLVSKKNYSKKMWSCSNDPEICDFLSNDLRGGSTRIRKCEKCKDGYLLIKKRRNVDAFFLGCSNYTNDATGCNNSIPLDFDDINN